MRIKCVGRRVGGQFSVKWWEHSLGEMLGGQKPAEIKTHLLQFDQASKGLR